MEPNPGRAYCFHILFLEGGEMIQTKNNKALRTMEDPKSFNWSIQEETVNGDKPNTQMVQSWDCFFSPQPQSYTIQRPLPYGCGSC